MNNRIQRVSFRPGQRVLITSDIHAHGHLLEALLHRASYRPGEDALVIAGDMLEKGPDSLNTLRLVMRLCGEGSVYPLIGNVDYWRYTLLMSDDPEEQKHFVKNALQYQIWWGSTFLHEMCREAGFPLKMDLDTQAIFPHLRQRFADELAFLSSLPTVIETDKMIFTHGGIPHENLDELENEPKGKYLKWDHFLEDGLSFQKYVVVGHWPVVLYSRGIPCYNPMIHKERHIISIDGGCGVKDEGQLNMLVLPDGDPNQFSFLSCDDLPHMTAMDAQMGGTDAHLIRWGDHYVTMLEKGDELSRVLHHGKELLVPSAYLYESDGRLCCQDVTDYVIPVSPGDSLGIITRLSDRCFVKKEGVHGWYFGRLNEGR